MLSMLFSSLEIRLSIVLMSSFCTEDPEEPLQRSELFPLESFDMKMP